MSFWGEIKGMKRVVWLTQRLQEVGVSGLKPLLVQQAEETAGHVDHVLDVEKQAVQVGWRWLRKRKRKSTIPHQRFYFETRLKHTAAGLQQGSRSIFIHLLAV